MSIEKTIEKGLERLITKALNKFFSDTEETLIKRIEASQRAVLNKAQKVIDDAEQKAKVKVRMTKAQLRAKQLEMAYSYLGVRPGDPESLVKGVYRAKAKHFHPDCKTGDKAAFQKLEAAYKLVMDDLRKRGKQ
ncbi:MAG: hypothetical protein AMS21_00800 [Gemmatimonas sp. SG8_38_2]|nr:MAG: hypothetical protein AMS21_00800 [Gemmatimonas sp. SG8_38_2]